MVLPTYNEAPNIADVLHRVRAAMPAIEVLVVDDGSPDGTADLAAAGGAEIGGVQVMRRTQKEGLGPAYRAGFAWAIERDFDIVVQMDADLSHDPALLPALVGAVEEGADFSIGSRYIAGGDVPDWPWTRRALSRWGNRYARWMLGLPGHDATTGFRAIRRHALEAASYDIVRADGYGFLIEMLYRLEHVGAKGVEIPLVFRDRTRGHSKMSSRIVVEAMVLVTGWGVRARLRALRRRGR